MSNEKAKLFAKIARVMAAVRTLPKDGENKFDKYNYITGDAVFERIGQAMATNNLVALPSIVELDTTVGESGSGKPMMRTVIHGQITLADGETGETHTCDWYGEGTDRGDKSINKALTAMMKYFLLRLFEVGSGDDADEDSPEMTQQNKAPTQTRPPQLQSTPLHTNGNGNSVPSFTNPDEAIDWGMNQGCFNARPHAVNAYNQLKTERKPKTAPEMFGLWVDDVKRRIEEKQAQPVAA